MSQGALPHFVVAGAPKAGTTALHAALATHPQLYLSPVKEPKHYLTGGRAPRRADHRGPGDAHSRREWVWRPEAYRSLFRGAPPGAVRGESTPFYLWDPRAVARLRADVPDVRLVAVVRDPVDRALSNWSHLRADGLEPEADFLRAVELEEARARAGWAPFWRYRGLGRYGEQLRRVLAVLPREQVHVLRYRDLVDSPSATLDAVCAFLGVAPGLAHVVPPENVKPHVGDDRRHRVLSRVVRAGAWAGSFAPPRVWRRAGEPLVRALHARPVRRQPLPVEVRRAVLAPLLPDIDLLEELTGLSVQSWRGDTGRGDFRSRTAAPAHGDRHEPTGGSGGAAPSPGSSTSP